MADYTFNPQTQSQNPPPESPETKDGKRIWNVFKSTIVLDELSVQQTKGAESQTQKVESLASAEFPLKIGRAHV